MNIGGTIGNSKPCNKCVEKLQNLPKKGYILDTVFYSVIGDTIFSDKFKNIDSSHITKYDAQSRNTKVVSR